MSLKNYFLESPNVVILDDKRDPYTSWQNHLDRTNGQRGGVDVVAVIGTPVIARTAGTVRRLPNNGSAGNSMEFAHDDNPGWRDVFSHLSGYVTTDRIGGSHFERGDTIAWSGNTGGVAPHLHWHLLDPNGNRRNPWDYFSEDDIMDYLGMPDNHKDAMVKDIILGTGRSTVPNYEGVQVNLIDILNGIERKVIDAVSNSRTAADAVTPGITGVKFDGATYAMSKYAAELAQKAVAGLGTVEVGKLDPVAVGEELANNPTFAVAFGKAFAEALASALTKGN